jgi:hypothetical protein
LCAKTSSKYPLALPKGNFRIEKAVSLVFWDREWKHCSQHSHFGNFNRVKVMVLLHIGWRTECAIIEQIQPHEPTHTIKFQKSLNITQVTSCPIFVTN